MAQFETASYSTQTNLLDLLSTFAQQTTAIWVEDNYEAGNRILEINNGNCYVQFEGDGTDIAMHQSLGWNVAQAPGTQTDDSGNGGVGTTDRQISAIGDTGGTYWFFAEHDGTDEFIHVVLEWSTAHYRHFSFGELRKPTDYTGGAYACAHLWRQEVANIDDPESGNHSVLMDGLAAANTACGTIHLEGMTGEPSASTKWACVLSGTAAGNDTAAVGRYPCSGGVRAGQEIGALGYVRASLLDGMFPGIPIKIRARDTATTPDDDRLLGTMPDVRMVQMALLDAKDEFTVGGDTWIVFPMTRNVFITPEKTSSTEESWNAGIAYRKSIP